MAHTTTTEYTCDICGTVWMDKHTVSHKLPDLSDLRGNFVTGSIFARTPPDYCGGCVLAVKEARDRVIEERRKIRK